jgi:hypothetical protein
MYASGKSTKKMALILTIDIAQFPGCPYSVCGIELEFENEVQIADAVKQILSFT